MGDDTHKFIDTTTRLMCTPECWDAIPAVCRTWASKATAFLYLARGRARIQALYDRDRDYPRKALATFVDETLVPEVLEDSKCPRRLDPWSREWMEYTGGNLTSPDAKAGAEQVLDLMASEQVTIEKMHSQVRQFLIGRSVQSRAVDLGTLISHKLLDHAKEGVAEEKRIRKLTLRERRAPQEREAPPQQKRTRRMSSWEVYRSEQTRGKAAEERPTQKEMSDTYSALPPENEHGWTKRQPKQMRP